MISIIFFFLLPHEYSHLLLSYNWRTNYLLIKPILQKRLDYRTSLLKNKFDYSIEQNIAILLQLSYEDMAGINSLQKRKAIQLMKYMGVLEID